MDCWEGGVGGWEGGGCLTGWGFGCCCFVTAGCCCGGCCGGCWGGCFFGACTGYFSYSSLLSSSWKIGILVLILA